MTSRLDLARQGDAILKRARCDSVTGAVRDRQHRRNKNAEQRRLARNSRARRKKLGTFGPASPGRRIEIEKDWAGKPGSEKHIANPPMGSRAVVVNQTVRRAPA